MNLSIVIPSFKESENLEIILPRLIKSLSILNIEYEILIIDSPISNDDTPEVCNKYDVNYKLRENGISYGDAIRTGIQSAKGERLLIMDADGSHDPDFVRVLWKFHGDYDVVIASRFAPGGGQKGVNGYRALISRSANLFMKVFYPIPGLEEYSCGFRGYRAEKIKEAIDFYGNNFIQLKGLGFTCTLEKLVKLKLIDAKFGEIPFMLRYDQKQSASKMVSSITTLGLNS